MPHIHDRYDFVVAAFLVYQKRVLLVFHKRYHKWLPVGGHIELDEDPEEALGREIFEETGLRVKVLAGKPRIAHAGVKPLLRPAFMDVHRIHRTHWHIGLVYFAVSPGKTVRLHEAEHDRFRWFRAAELSEKKYRLSRSIRFYCRQALRAAGKGRTG
ncbi:MAG: NUDIX hydrolase [Candidatus Omnitrophota bacterium]